MCVCVCNHTWREFPTRDSSSSLEHVHFSVPVQQSVKVVRRTVPHDVKSFQYRAACEIEHNIKLVSLEC